MWNLSFSYFWVPRVEANWNLDDQQISSSPTFRLMSLWEAWNGRQMPVWKPLDSYCMAIKRRTNGHLIAIQKLCYNHPATVLRLSDAHPTAFLRPWNGHLTEVWRQCHSHQMAFKLHSIPSHDKCHHAHQQHGNTNHLPSSQTMCDIRLEYCTNTSTIDERNPKSQKIKKTFLKHR